MKKMIGLALILLLFVSGCGENAIPESHETPDNSPVSTPQITDGEENTAPDPSDTGDDGVKVIIPDFTTTDLEGSTVTQDIFSGKDLTVVNIWGTYCGPCINEMPELGEWAAEMPDNVQLMGIVCDLMTGDEGETLELAQDIVARTGAGYTNIAMCNDLAWIAYSVQGVPATFFVNGSGEIVGQTVLGAMWIGIRPRWRCCWMKTRDKRRLAAGLAALTLASLLIAAGIGRGEIGIVAQKAINICFECIGLG